MPLLWLNLALSCERPNKQHFQRFPAYYAFIDIVGLRFGDLNKLAHFKYLTGVNYRKIFDFQNTLAYWCRQFVKSPNCPPIFFQSEKLVEGKKGFFSERCERVEREEGITFFVSSQDEVFLSRWPPTSSSSDYLRAEATHSRDTCG